MSRLSVERWRREVFKSRHPEMTGAVKVLLLYLSEPGRMRVNDRKVSVPRKTVARDLGCHESGVAERYSKAVRAEYLANVLSGHTGRTAVYQAILPDCVPESGTQSRSSRAGERTDHTDTVGVLGAVHSPESAERESRGLRTGERYTNVEADLSSRSTDRHVGNNEEAQLLPVRSELTVCDCHGFPDCSSLSRSHARGEKTA